MSRRLCCLAALFAVAAALALPFDMPLMSYFQGEEDWDAIHDLVTLAEVFAHGLGAACILLTAYVLDVPQRRRMPRIIVAVVAAGLSADVIKVVVGRMRPRALAVDQVWDSFAGWFPLFYPEIRQGMSVSNCQSFPSGHATVATALAIGLCILYPRGRWLFVGFAVLGSMQRVESCAHYLSDTLAGAALACLVCAACLGRHGIGRWFERRESIGDTNGERNRCSLPGEPIP